MHFVMHTRTKIESSGRSLFTGPHLKILLKISFTMAPYLSANLDSFTKLMHHYYLGLQAD